MDKTVTTDKMATTDNGTSTTLSTGTTPTTSNGTAATLANGTAPTTGNGTSTAPSGPSVELPHAIRAVRDAKSYVSTGRTIVICLDGTGDQLDSDNSNIVHIVSALKKSDTQQLTYYQSGIGTYSKSGLSSGFHSAIDASVGSGLGLHVRQAYTFLMTNYKEGDKICIFGFSRGAYTARCVAGMVHKVGILPAHNEEQVEFAYKFYKDDSSEGWRMSQEFKKTFCMNASVYFIGVFDSVASVGLIPRKLPLSSTPTNKAVYFRHAISLDEHRAKFKVCRFRQRVSIGDAKGWKVEAEMDKKEKLLSSEEPESDVLEVHFVGCHADCGGGAVKNEVRNKLSQIPLRWMIRQAFECDTGIIFKAESLLEEGIDMHRLYPKYKRPNTDPTPPPPEIIEMHKNGALPSIKQRRRIVESLSMKDKFGKHHIRIAKDNETVENGWLPEQTEDYFDALSPINDQLVQAKGWWILEVIPVKVRMQLKDSDEWIKKVRMNLGRARCAQEKAPLMHWTVQHRIDTAGYEPKIRTDRNATWKKMY